MVRHLQKGFPHIRSKHSSQYLDLHVIWRLHTRKIAAREVGEQQLRGRIIRQRRFQRGLVPPQIDSLPMLPNARLPFVLVEDHALVATGVVDLASLVTLVLAARGEAQVGAPVVEPIAVDMVHLEMWRGVHDETVHMQHLAPVTSIRVVHRIAMVVEAPAAQKDKTAIVGIVDERNSALGEGDGFHEVVLRGNGCYEVKRGWAIAPK